ncbi:restriction endonuclease subunit S [Stenotrophomonas sp. Marseille-Q4652]|uniref:restriction endonuclease subunit S n=1 Tax=Stenotrophomonas sp. Marseille-Q4652 TaxID=2866595 RepID=UPI001CE41D5A|nr:restriction endonuclease subunit S [Stenotrophomonas sp. Marseille-Q4652]
MAKQSEKTAVPRLRFPEFRHHVGFGPAALGRAFGQITNGKANAQDHEEGGAFPLFDRSEVIKASSKFAFDSEAVILPGEGMSFRPRYFEGKFDLHQRAYALMECQGHSKYFYYALDHAKAELALKAVKSTVLSLRLPIIEKFVVFAPTDNAEQQKIADCLTSLDEVIAAQGRKVEALKAHKRGLMQQLFPREGETRPRLRFPEFRDAPEWEKKQLAELGEIITGKTPSTSNAGLWGGGILFITPTDIDDSGKYQDTSQRTVVATSALKVLPVGSIAYTCIASIGKLAITVRPSVTNQQINSVITRPSIDNEFVYYALVHLTPWIKSIPATSTLPIINKTEFSAIEIGIPSDSLEQKAVADCLSSLDTRITAETHQLAALKTHKQGLMQQLFPALEEAQA